MNLAQLERRLRALELTSHGFDYVRIQDEKDAQEDTDTEDAARQSAEQAAKDAKTRQATHS